MDAKGLTQRQREVLAKSAQGFTSEQIANFLFISHNTVRSTFTSARKRLKASNTTQAVVLAIAKEELCLNHEGYCYTPEIEK